MADPALPQGGAGLYVGQNETSRLVLSFFSVRNLHKRDQCHGEPNKSLNNERGLCRNQQLSHSWQIHAPVILAILVTLLGSHVRVSSAATVKIDAIPKRVIVNYGDETQEITCTYTLIHDGHLPNDSYNNARKDNQLKGHGSEDKDKTDAAAVTDKGKSSGEANDNATKINIHWNGPIEANAEDGIVDFNKRANSEVDSETSQSATITATQHSRIAAAKLDKIPNFINLKLYDDNLEGVVMIRKQNFRLLHSHPLELKFQLKNVKQSAKFSCELSSTDVLPARDEIQVYVRTTDKCSSTFGQCSSRSRTTMCVDEQYCVCLNKYQRKHGPGRDVQECRPTVRASRCYGQDKHRYRRCTFTRKIAMESYKKINSNDRKRFNVSTAILIDGNYYISEGVERDCYICTEADPSVRFMTALMVTFLVLISGAMSVVGVVILYDWWKRRRDLIELEREHTEQNASTFDAEAVRRAAEDRPPSYLETRRSDLHLAGPPPPSYEDVCKGASEGGDCEARTPNTSRTSSYDRVFGSSRMTTLSPPSALTGHLGNLQYAVSVSRLASDLTSSVPDLETIHERRISL